MVSLSLPIEPCADTVRLLVSGVVLYSLFMPASKKMEKPVVGHFEIHSLIPLVPRNEPMKKRKQVRDGNMNP